MSRAGSPPECPWYFKYARAPDGSYAGSEMLDIHLCAAIEPAAAAIAAATFSSVSQVRAAHRPRCVIC